jgi:DNA-directed RNA polymerase subunit RPC12/RpoP
MMPFSGPLSVAVLPYELQEHWMAAESATHVCPKCSSDEITRVPRRFLRDYLQRLLGRRVYRCVDCGTRFYDRPSGGRSVA